MKQATFAGLAFDAKKKTTKREKFLAEMDKVVPYGVDAPMRRDRTD